MFGLTLHYLHMRFIGPPFTFGFEQVGTNCGLIGQNAAIEVDGTAYWMSENGFFKYAGAFRNDYRLFSRRFYL